MDYLPLFHRLQHSPILLVGGGMVALRKARLLAKAGASLTVIGPTIEPELEELLTKHQGQYIQRPFQEKDTQGYTLVIAATNNIAVNQQVAKEAQQLAIDINVVDNPELSSVIFPAIVDRSPVIIAVSSAGSAPVLARQLRAKLEALLPNTYGKLAIFCKNFRDQVKQHLPHVNQRRFFWERFLDSPQAEQVLMGQADNVQEQLLHELKNHSSHYIGEVYLIGAGPGDPDLLTFKAHRLMQQADVVLYDRLVSPAILDLCRRDAELIYVGKKGNQHTLPQQNINELLVTLAQQGKRVARLKGGDPFIFGRGGEEIAELASQHIPFQVIPGVTAANGCAAYAGIPLTHRDYAQTVRFVTGHLQKDTIDLPWQELTTQGQTVVFYMGLLGLSIICQQLIAHGRSADTPIALIEQGTMPNQRVFTGTLATLPEQVAHAKIHAPTLIIVGEVVNLHQHLAWFTSHETSSGSS